MQEAEQQAYWELVQALLAVAQAQVNRQDQEAESTVRWLVGFAQGLAGQLGINLGSGEDQGEMSEDPEEQQRFLLEVLQSITQNYSDLQVIYPLLRQNLELLDDRLISVLKTWTRATIAESASDVHRSIAASIWYFGSLIQDFPLGNKADNMELAIASYELALEIHSVDVVREEWAGLQNNRANAYSDRIKGDRGENLENAIAGYEAALEIYTKENFPFQWAMTQNNRALTLSDRIKGDRGENLENAIEGYEAALEIYTKENFPLDWAMTQNNRANAYLNRIKEDRGENLEGSSWIPGR
jgi:tetratricopeptide (TPR) repeat protein